MHGIFNKRVLTILDIVRVIDCGKNQGDLELLFHFILFFNQTTKMGVFEIPMVFDISKL